MSKTNLGNNSAYFEDAS